jgi:general secretion pathway protein D
MTSAIMGVVAGAVAGAAGGETGSNGGSENLVSTLTDSRRDRFVDFQSNGGLGKGFYGDRHINALLTAMQQKDYGRVLAKPKILVNDNEPGMISSMDVTYVMEQGSTIVPGQTGGSVQTSIAYVPYDAGITLNITPHISSGDLLRLDISLERSDFGTITGDKPPDTQESHIETTVTIPDGSTIILGGLIKLNQSKGGTKIPILGDLPLIGGLFRSASNSDLQRSLYVFVKAEIIRPSETGLAQADLERISERNRTAFEESETEFQEYQDWSGIKPEPMKPLKVLDAQ